MQLRPFLRFNGGIPKKGSRDSENEDRFGSSPDSFAVADGASDGIYSDVWAEILATSFCRTRRNGWEPEAVHSWIRTCQEAWRDWERRLTARSLPWFTREKLSFGSFASFVGVAFSSEADGAWRAVAYGDSCVFVVRRDSLLDSFPMSRSDHFDSTPPLIRTHGELNDNELALHDGRCEPGDRIYLASDALAQWFLRDCENGEEPWISFDGVATTEELSLLVAEPREAGAMRNDDVTLVAVEVLAVR